MTDALELEAVPEGVCVTAGIPNTGAAGLGPIVVNPYGVAPLTAIIRDGGLAISAAEVRVKGRGVGGIDIHYPVSDRALWTHGGIPVFGLYPDHVNTVEVSYWHEGHRIDQRLDIYAPPVRLPVVAGQTAILPQVIPVTVAPELRHRLYLFNHLLVGHPDSGRLRWNADGGAAEWDQIAITWIADTRGEVRWYLDIERLRDSNRLDRLGSSMGFHQTQDGKLIFGQGQTYAKYDLLGRPIWHRALPAKFADFSHEIRATAKGTYLLRVAASDYRRTDGKRVRTVRDHIIEVDESGDVVDFWDLNKVLDPYRADLLHTLGKAAVLLPVGAKPGASLEENERLEGDRLPFGDIPGVGAGRNWAHVNAIDHDPSDDALIVSARHQGVFKIGRDKSLKWILSAPKGWGERYRPYLLTPVDAAGNPLPIKDGNPAPPFDWPWTQHTAWLTGKGTLTVFDNGWGRHFAETRLTGNYSRAVEYRIDEKKRTVEQVWEYGRERGDAWYSPVTSVVQYRPDSDTQLIYSASIGFLTAEKLTTPVLTEVRYGTQEVVLELQLRSRQPGNIGYRALVIDPALAF
ncbi:aryl-sulfate sulfotransferase [Candidatus Methylocalor cossyra]|uniref:Arylsulfate sulfotransferase AssT n=1 Tax=Candidatus Methylocalor cossyra TaxID=3108543 RepID=A0ABP1C7X6_9GAMM